MECGALTVTEYLGDGPMWYASIQHGNIRIVCMPKLGDQMDEKLHVPHKKIAFT